MKRRSFLKVVGGAAGGVAAGISPVFGDASPEVAGALPRRVLGRTGFKVSIVGFPGFGLMHDAQEVCTAAVRRAFDAGVNYYDVAPAYANGDCENKLGVALQGLERQKYFLACKTKMRDQAGARAELERSLKRLKTDYFDLYQFHHLAKPDDVKQVLGPGGALETVLKAKQEGKIRFIGFSGHTTKAALLALRGFKFDTVMFPINFVEYYTRGFGKEVLAVAGEQGTAVVAIKPMSGGSWPAGKKRSRDWWYWTLEDPEEVALAWRFTLSQPGVVAGFPPSWLDLLDKAVAANRQFRPLTEAEGQKLQAMAAGRGSLFKREEDQIARNLPHRTPYPERPHECAPEAWG